jgi:hypothetical protein
MKVLRATMIAAVCAFSAGATSGSVLDVERSGTVSIVAVTPPSPPAAPDVVEVTPIIEANVGNEVSVGGDAIVVADQGECLAGAEGNDVAGSVGDGTGEDGTTSGPIPEVVNPSDVPADEPTGC